MVSIRLKAGREKSLLRRHPWVFSGAIAEIRGTPQDGETVDLFSARGEFLGRGAFSAHSQIQARIWTWQADQNVDAVFFRRRLEQAIAARQANPPVVATDAVRLVHAESDQLPGLIVDRYGRSLVVQFLSSGAERWREVLVPLLAELTQTESIYERSDVDVRQLEGLPERRGLLWGVEPPEKTLITEGGLKFRVDLRQGHKTGYYLDQRLNRAQVGQLARGRQVLDCFSYSGGFTLATLAGGAESVLAVDSSAAALDLLQDNLALNALPAERVERQAGDVFQVLRSLRDQGRSFDLVVLDPPKFAPTAAQAHKAARGYKDINLLAFKLLRPGGLLATFSCSGGISEDLFQKIVAGAALDAGVQAQILQRLAQDRDHPVALNFPEGAYLKGLILRL